MKKVTIDPITRLEGHGRIEIFLDDAGNVANAYLQVPEFRGFERFCEGRPVEEMPRITPRICGVCPSAHHRYLRRYIYRFSLCRIVRYRYRRCRHAGYYRRNDVG